MTRADNESARYIRLLQTGAHRLYYIKVPRHSGQAEEGAHLHEGHLVCAILLEQLLPLGGPSRRILEQVRDFKFVQRLLQTTRPGSGPHSEAQTRHQQDTCFRQVPGVHARSPPHTREHSRMHALQRAAGTTGSKFKERAYLDQLHKGRCLIAPHDQWLLWHRAGPVPATRAKSAPLAIICQQTRLRFHFTAPCAQTCCRRQQCA